MKMLPCLNLLSEGQLLYEYKKMQLGLIYKLFVLSLDIVIDISIRMSCSNLTLIISWSY